MAHKDFSSVDFTPLLDRPHLLRVPKFLVNSPKEDYYTPQYISLGPYHSHNPKLEDAHVKDANRNDKRLIQFSSNDLYKLKFVRKQLKINAPNAKSLDDMVQVPIIDNREHRIELFYNLPISQGEKSSAKETIRKGENSSAKETISKGENSSAKARIAQMMMMDSLFLLCFLSTNNGDHGDYDVVIKCDILKLDNQIPLFVLEAVCTVCDSVNWNHPITMATLLWNAYTELSPFHTRDKNTSGENTDTLLNHALRNEHHLLGCIHAIVSPFLEIKDDPPSTEATPTLLQTIFSKVRNLLQMIFNKVRNLLFSNEGNLPIKGYNAVQLASAGIKFKSFSSLSSKIRFDKGSHTLHLPQMTVSSVQTEVFFRNLVAMEFNESFNSDKRVTRFIQLTDCLIDTADDVNVLRKSQVITSESKITDETIAIIWNSMHHPFYRGHIQPPEQLKSALDDVLGTKNSFNYCKIKIRIVLWEFFDYYYQTYFSHPWSFLAMLAGIFLLALTLIQTYCSLRGYSSMIKLYANL